MKEQNTPKISRRAFLNRTLWGITAVGLGPLNVLRLGAQESTPTLEHWAAGASQCTFHMIGHGHIDPVWLWSWREGLSVVMSTFRAALDRMEENPLFRFTASSALFYKWVAENDPETMQRIRKRIKEGRWNVVGGWWIEPDVNLPCGESLVRQGLYGQRTLEQLTGQRAHTAFLPDSFGHSGSLPQIIRQQGMENYVFMRPMSHEKKLPSDLFRWEGPDGSRLTAYRIQIGYSNSRSIRQRLERTLSETTPTASHTYMSFYGAGDHGGGATKDNFKQIASIRTQDDAPRLIYSTPDAFFNAIHSDIPQLPIVKGDLKMHAVGCYTVDSAIKKGNRQTETALILAEKIASIGHSGWGAHYPRTALQEAWEQLLFLQFHDSLAGTSQAEHTAIAQEGYGFARNRADRTRSLALQKLEWQIASEDPESEYLVVFNPHAWPLQTLLGYDLNIKGDAYPCDDTGTVLPYQWSVGSSQCESVKKLLFMATLPAMGYRQIRVRKGVPSEGTLSSALGTVTVNGTSLENQWLKVSFLSDGSIEIFDKREQRLIFASGVGGCQAIVLDDPSDTWSHNVVAYREPVGKFANASIQPIETGAIRATVRVISHYKSSTLTIDWSLQAGSCSLEANVSLDWHEQHKILKFSFPVGITSPEATAEVPYANMPRPLEGEEETGQRWVDITGTDQGRRFGFSLLNDAKYGYSFEQNDLRMSVVRSPVYAHHAPNKLDPDKAYIWMDQGIQTFRMQLIPHTGGWQEAGIPRQADLFCEEPIVTYQGIHHGTLPKSLSFLYIEGEGIQLGALKLAEENDDLIVRCVESLGHTVEAQLHLSIYDLAWHGSFRPYEIKTLRIKPTKKSIREVNLLEE